MTDKEKDIHDDEFRVIGRTGGSNVKEERRRNLLVAAVSIALVILIGLLAVINWPGTDNPETDVHDPETSGIPIPSAPLGHITDSTLTEKIDTVINDIPLSLYLPHNSIPELSLGVPSGKDVILAAQAADVRADNGKILGAFVLKGKPLAWGLSKKGFCAIIDGIVTIGKSDNSPLFEAATEKDGYFFRQYPMVDNGGLVDNEPRGKAMRKALCARSGQIFVAVSETDESFHDFAQALVDFGVENAIYLVGGRDSGGWWIDANGNSVPFTPESRTGTYRNETYIFWR